MYGLARIRRAGVELDRHPEVRSLQAFYELGVRPPTHQRAADIIIQADGGVRPDVLAHCEEIVERHGRLYERMAECPETPLPSGGHRAAPVVGQLARYHSSSYYGPHGSRFYGNLRSNTEDIHARQSHEDGKSKQGKGGRTNGKS